MNEKNTRLIDANGNRLVEAIRVIEDIARFVRNDRLITSRLKEIRHKTTQLLPQYELLKRRDVKGDIGRDAEFDISRKESVNDILLANFSRAEESARVLEEFLSLEFKEIRFSLYGLEKAMLMRKKIDLSLYVITNRGYCRGKPLPAVVEESLKGGATAVQLRDKDAHINELIEEASMLIPLTKKYNVPLIINDRVDVCMAVDADGVHLGEEDMRVEYARDILGDGKIIGFSTSSTRRAKKVEYFVDYIGCGSVYKSPTKSSKDVIGIPKLQKMVKAIKKDVVAIGGINLDNLREVMDVGVTGIALCAGIFDVQNVRRQTRRYKKEIERKGGVC